MGIKDIFGKLKPEDIPILTVPEQEILQDYLQKQPQDVTFDKICFDTNLTKERILEINNEISIHFRDNIAPKVFFKAMLSTNKGDNTEFELFFQRPDVDLGCLFMNKIKDIKENMRNLDTPAYIFYLDNWKKYRGY